MIGKIFQSVRIQPSNQKDALFSNNIGGKKIFRFMLLAKVEGLKTQNSLDIQEKNPIIYKDEKSDLPLQCSIKRTVE